MDSFWVSIAFLLTGLSGVSLGQDQIIPGESNVRLHGATDTHAIWVASDLISSTARHVAPSHTYRIYLQKLDEPAAKLIQTVSGTSIRDCSVSKSGSLISTNGQQGLSWRSLDGSINYEPVSFGSFDLHADGLVLNRRPDCYFVPFKNSRVDLASRVTLKNAGSYPSLGLPNTRVVRHGNRLAWVGEKTSMANMTTKPHNLAPKPSKGEDRKKQYAIYTHNIETQHSRTTDLDVGWADFCEARMFDGKFLLVEPQQIFDVETGRLVSNAPTNFPKVHSHCLKFFENGFVYYWHEQSLYAVNLLNQDSVPIKMAPMPRGWGITRNTKGPVVWDLKTWRTLKWIEKPPLEPMPEQ